MGFFKNLAAMYRMASKEEIQASTTTTLIHPTTLTGPMIGNIQQGRGNQFTTYQTQVGQGWKRYKNQAEFGNEVVRTVTKFRTGIICGNGANIESRSSQEKKFIDTFLEYNPLDASLLNKIVTGTEIEGKFLVYIDTEKITNDKGLPETIIRLKYLKWYLWHYTIITDDLDDRKIIRVEFRDSKKQLQKINADEIVYMTVDDGDLINEPIPPISTVLQSAVNMSQALADWRDMNHFWGSLGMHYECPDVATASMMINTLSAKETAGGWKYGDVMAGPAKAYFPEPSGAGQQSIGNEIDMNARIISGTSGVPVHHMGWAKEMSNRATAEELTDSIIAHTAANKDAIEAGVREIVRKSVAIYNKHNSTNLDYNKIDVNITRVSSQQIKELIDVYFPLAEAGYIHKDDLINRIPGIDPNETKKKLAADGSSPVIKDNQANQLQEIRSKTA